MTSYNLYYITELTVFTSFFQKIRIDFHKDNRFRSREMKISVVYNSNNHLNVDRIDKLL